jgi:LEA14-like dessication related protein
MTKASFATVQLFFALIASVLAVSSCSSIASKVIEKPTVRLASVGIKDANPQGVTVVFGVEVDNPNSFALKIDALRYAAEIGGRPFSSGALTDLKEVPGKGKAVVDLDVAVKYSDLFTSVLDFVSNGTTKYHVKGDASFGILTIPFEQSGDLKLKQ